MFNQLIIADPDRQTELEYSKFIAFTSLHKYILFTESMHD